HACKGSKNVHSHVQREYGCCFVGLLCCSRYSMYRHRRGWCPPAEVKANATIWGRTVNDSGLWQVGRGNRTSFPGVGENQCQSRSSSSGQCLHILCGREGMRGNHLSGVNGTTRRRDRNICSCGGWGTYLGCCPG